MKFKDLDSLLNEIIVKNFLNLNVQPPSSEEIENSLNDNTN